MDLWWYDSGIDELEQREYDQWLDIHTNGIKCELNENEREYELFLTDVNEINRLIRLYLDKLP